MPLNLVVEEGNRMLSWLEGVHLGGGLFIESEFCRYLMRLLEDLVRAAHPNAGLQVEILNLSDLFATMLGIWGGADDEHIRAALQATLGSKKVCISVLLLPLLL